MTTLLGLPAELLHRICVFCTKNDIESLRLTSRALCLIADEHLLEEVVTCFERDDLATVSEIAKNAASGIRKGVKSLLIQADVFSQDEELSLGQWWRGRGAFFKTIRHDVPSLGQQFHGRRKNKRNSERLEAFKRYIRYGLEDLKRTRPEKSVSHQKCIDLDADLCNIMNERLDKSTLDNLFAACPNINSVTINTGHSLRRNAGLTNLAYLQSLSVPNLPGECLVNHAIETTLVALSHAGINLKSLALAGIGLKIMEHSEIVRESNRERSELLLHEATAHLKSLHLKFRGWDDCDQDKLEDNEMKFNTSEFGEGHLERWLEHCRLIQDLRLRLPKAPWARGQMPIDYVLGEKVQLKSLSVLHLQYFQSEAEQLAQVLLRYKTTLRSLEISDAHLDEGTWPYCLNLIAGKFERLQHARFAGELSAVEEGDITNYDFSKNGPSVEKYIITGAGKFAMRGVRRVDMDSEDSGDENEITDELSTDE